MTQFSYMFGEEGSLYDLKGNLYWWAKEPWWTIIEEKDYMFQENGPYWHSAYYASYVYILKRDKMVKVGRSQSPHLRACQLKSNLFFMSEPLFLWNAMSLEVASHRRLREFNIPKEEVSKVISSMGITEWYSCAPRKAMYAIKGLYNKGVKSGKVKIFKRQKKRAFQLYPLASPMNCDG